jgi:hypothetical protein
MLLHLAGSGRKDVFTFNGILKLCTVSVTFKDNPAIKFISIHYKRLSGELLNPRVFLILALDGHEWKDSRSSLFPPAILFIG